MKKKLVGLLATATLISGVFSPLTVYADQPGDPVDTAILEEVKSGCSGEIVLYDSIKRALVTYNIGLTGNTLSVKGSDGTNFSFNITNRSNYVGYNYTTSGNPVKAAQILLNVYKARTGYGNSIAVDSLFGPATHSMVILFQEKNSLSVYATIGPNTWRKLCSYL